MIETIQPNAKQTPNPHMRYQHDNKELAGTTTQTAERREMTKESREESVVLFVSDAQC